MALEITEESFNLKDKVLAWSVHAFTASGILLGLLAIAAISQHHWREAMGLLLLCAVIDGVDGTFARICKVQQVLPEFDGKMIDYVIDFSTYAVIPAYFVYESPLVPEPVRFLAAGLMLLISAYYYGKKGMVSDDYYFIGFPVLWNLVVFYLFFVCDFSAWWNFIWILIFVALHIIPLKYLYPSRTVAYRKLTLVISVLGAISYPLILFFYPEKNLLFNGFAILTAAYFMFMAVYKTYFSKV